MFNFQASFWDSHDPVSVSPADIAKSISVRFGFPKPFYAKNVCLFGDLAPAVCSARGTGSPCFAGICHHMETAISSNWDSLNLMGMLVAIMLLQNGFPTTWICKKMLAVKNRSFILIEGLVRVLYTFLPLFLPSFGGAETSPRLTFRLELWMHKKMFRSIQSNGIMMREGCLCLLRQGVSTLLPCFCFSLFLVVLQGRLRPRWALLRMVGTVTDIVKEWCAYRMDAHSNWPLEDCQSCGQEIFSFLTK